jgi:hypothetical protein
LSTESFKELADHVCQNSTNWILYLRNISNHAAILDGGTANPRAATADLENAIAKRDEIIQYQRAVYRKELDANQKKIIQPEVEKTQLLTAATSAVYIPRNESVPEPKLAVGPCRCYTRPTAFTPSVGSRSSHLSGKLPNPKGV